MDLGHKSDRFFLCESFDFVAGAFSNPQDPADLHDNSFLLSYMKDALVSPASSVFLRFSPLPNNQLSFLLKEMYLLMLLILIL